MNNKIIIYGGNFNPIHLGHLQIIEKLQNSSFFDKILILPTGFSNKASNISFADKTNIIKTALRPFPKAELIFLENKPYPTPTIQTLIKLKQIYRFDKVSLCIGEDNFSSFDSWVTYQRVLGMLDKLVIFARNGTKTNTNSRYLRYLLLTKPELFEIIPFDVDISSTEIRENLQKKDYNYELENKLDRASLNYIKTINLYN